MDDSGPIMFPMVAACRKTGQEQFHSDSAPLGIDLLSFWQWSASDLLGNRPQLAEYIVACALGLNSGMCSGWGSHDLETKDGKKAEVKSSAYLQGWAQKGYTKPSFSIKPARSWTPATGEMGKEAKRQAEVYVFALLKHKDAATLDPLNVAQWEFYVLPASVLNEKLPAQKNLSLASLSKLRPVVSSYDELNSIVQSLSFASSTTPPGFPD